MKRVDRALSAYRAAGARAGVPKPETETPRTGGTKNEGPDAAISSAERVHELLSGPPSEDGITKAAKFLLLLDKESASKIMSHFSEVEVEKISRRIAHIRRIETQDARNVLEEFGVLTSRGVPSRGGPDAAKSVLVAAFGEEKGNTVFRRVFPLGVGNPFSFLDELETSQIIMLFRKEPNSVVSVVLPYMEAKKASEVIVALDPDRRMEVVRRIARLQKVSPEALAKVAEALREKIRKQGRLVTEEVDGRSALAEILRYMSLDKEDEILAGLDELNPEITEEIRERLLTIDVIFLLDDQDLQSILRDFSEIELAVILKGKEEKVRARILSNMSERRGLMVRDEMDHLGPMKRRDVDKATRELLQYIRELEDEGRIAVHRDDQYIT